MKVFLLDNCQSWSWSRKRNFFSAPAPANYGSGRLRLRNTEYKLMIIVGEKYFIFDSSKEVQTPHIEKQMQYCICY